MKNKIILISILPIFSISSFVALNYHLNNKVNKKLIVSNKKRKQNQQSNINKIYFQKNKKQSSLKHNRINDLNLNVKNKINDFQNISIVLNPSFQKHIVFSPYIYHFCYEEYQKNKNGIYQLISHDVRIWNHKEVVQVAYPFLNSTYANIVGVKGKYNDLKLNKNFNFNAKELENISKNSLKLNLDAIGLVSDPHMYLNYHYQLKNKTPKNNKASFTKHNNKNINYNDDCFNKHLSYLKSHFKNEEIKFFGYYDVFNLKQSANNWINHNLINFLLILLPLAISIITNMFCGLLTGLISNTIISEIKGFIFSFGLNLIDSTITKGYLGYSYMIGDAFFIMGESEMEFIASGVGGFFADGESISKMQKSFVSESSEKTIEYAGDDDMQSKMNGTNNIKISYFASNNHFINGSNSLNSNVENNSLSPYNENHENQPSVNVQNDNANNDNTAVDTHNTNTSQNLNEIEERDVEINDSFTSPVVVEENNYTQYDTQLVNNHYSYATIQEDPNRGINDEALNEESENSSNNSNQFVTHEANFNFIDYANINTPIDEEDNLIHEEVASIDEENFDATKSIFIGINIDSVEKSISVTRPFGGEEQAPNSQTVMLKQASPIQQIPFLDCYEDHLPESLSIDKEFIDHETPFPEEASHNFHLNLDWNEETRESIKDEDLKVEDEKLTQNLVSKPIEINKINPHEKDSSNSQGEEFIAKPFGEITDSRDSLFKFHDLHWANAVNGKGTNNFSHEEDLPLQNIEIENTNSTSKITSNLGDLELSITSENTQKSANKFNLDSENAKMIMEDHHTTADCGWLFHSEAPKKSIQETTDWFLSGMDEVQMNKRRIGKNKIAKPMKIIEDPTHRNNPWYWEHKEKLNEAVVDEAASTIRKDILENYRIRASNPVISTFEKTNYTQLVGNHYSHETIQDDPDRGINNETLNEESKDSSNNSNQFVTHEANFNFIDYANINTPIDEEDNLIHEEVSPIDEENFDATKSIFVGINIDSVEKSISVTRPFGGEEQAPNSQTVMLKQASPIQQIPFLDCYEDHLPESLSIDKEFIDHETPFPEEASHNFHLNLDWNEETRESIKDEDLKVEDEKLTQNLVSKPIEINKINPHEKDSSNSQGEEFIAKPFGEITDSRYSLSKFHDHHWANNFDDNLLPTSDYDEYLALPDSLANLKIEGTIEEATDAENHGNFDLDIFPSPNFKDDELSDLQYAKKARILMANHDKLANCGLLFIEKQSKDEFLERQRARFLDNKKMIRRPRINNKVIDESSPINIKKHPYHKRKKQ